MSFTIESGKEAGLIQINVVPKPIVLCQIQAINPATKEVDSGSDSVYLTTTPTLGGETRVWNGNTYQARLMSNPIDQIQANSPEGYDIPGSISLQIADGDLSIWLSHANLYGWRGGTLTVTFLLWDAPSASYSTNAYVWTFILEKPNVDAKAVIAVSATARLSMTRLTVPDFARQNRCGNTFPSTAAQRFDGLHNPTSMYWGCGYSPDQTGGIGNTTTANLTNPDGSALTDAAGIFLVCDWTRSCGSRTGTATQGCMARLGNSAGNPVGAGITVIDGDITRDQAGHPTARFTGDTATAPVGWSGKQYVNPSAGKQYGFNVPNPATGTSYINQGYGTQWVDATVLAVYGDPNSTRAECVVCMAPNAPAYIWTVLCNGVELPLNGADALFTYRIVTLGGRQGAVCLDSSFYQGAGDPHGSQCVIEIIVPVELATSTSIPSVQVLLQLPQCLHAMPIASAAISGGNTALTVVDNPFDVGVGSNIYVAGNSGVPNGSYPVVSTSSSPPTIVISGVAANGTGGGGFYIPDTPGDGNMVDSAGAAAANPVWALLDLLAMWGPFTAADFDATTWYVAAQLAATPIGYTDINGIAATHARYRCSFVLTFSQRQSLAKAVLAIRNSAAILLGRSPLTGQIQCFLEGTLADQQPAPIPGSNYNTAVASLTALSVAANGYLAYLFDGAGSIEADPPFKLGGLSTNETPNTVAFPFQDSANAWVQDSCTTIDPGGYTASGSQEIQQSIAMLGIENFDQATRMSNLQLAKAMYMNMRFDAGGSELPTFRTTVKAAHLANRVGFIVGINYEQLGV